MKIARSIMFTVVFVVLLFIISFIFQAIGQMFINQDPYKLPKGHAVKVFQQDEYNEHKQTMFERLAIFYIYGEN